MRLSRTTPALLAALLIAGTAAAQQPPMMVGGPAPIVLRTGTAIQMETLTELTTEGKKLHVGDRFEMATTDPVMLNGQTVIPGGSHGVGEVTSVRNKGMWGKSGGITAHVLYIEANGRQMRLSGSFDDKGETGTGGVVASVLLVPVVGFLVTGTSARIAPHSRVHAFLDEDVPVQFASGATTGPAPMVIGAPTTNTPAPASPQPATPPQPVGTPGAVAPNRQPAPAAVTPVSATVPQG